MIRVNLLPVSKVRKQEALIIQGVIGLAALIVVVIGCFLIGAAKKGTIEDLDVQIKATQAELRKLKAKVGEVERYKGKLRILEEQISVIRALQAGRVGPVRVLDELSDLVPRKLWLHSFSEKAHQVTIQGVASSGPVIADFLDNLNRARYFETPVLTSVNAADEKGIKVQKFNITVGVTYDR